MDKQRIWSWFSQSNNEIAQTEELKDNLSEMQTWMRNLEQHLMSVNARLGAVEHRITGSSSIHQTPQDSLIPNEGKDEPSSLILMNELTKNQLQRFEKQLTTLSDKIDSVDEKQASFTSFRKETSQFVQSMKAQKNNQPVIMKIGRKEIPLELSGVLGGIICFVVAGLAAIGATEIVLSPLFLTGIGLVLVSGTFFRTEFRKLFLKKVNKIVFPHSKKSRLHQ